MFLDRGSRASMTAKKRTWESAKGTAFALKQLTGAEETRIAALVKKALE